MSDIHLIIATGFLFAVFSLWLAVRTFQRERVFLWVLIPLFLTFSILAGRAYYRVMGFPTHDLSDLNEEFNYVMHFGQDPIFLVAVPNGSTLPRLYAIPASGLSDEEKQALSGSGRLSAQGIPQSGQFSEGELRMYDFDVTRLMPKEG